MGFKKINAEEEIRKAAKEDKEFEKCMELLKMKHTLIKDAVNTRKNLGLTQKEVGTRCDFVQQDISRIEKLDATPTLDSFISYISALGLELKLIKKECDNSNEEACTIC